VSGGDAGAHSRPPGAGGHWQWPPAWRRLPPARRRGAAPVARPGLCPPRAPEKKNPRATNVKSESIARLAGGASAKSQARPQKMRASNPSFKLRTKIRIASDLADSDSGSESHSSASRGEKTVRVTASASQCATIRPVTLAVEARPPSCPVDQHWPSTFAGQITLEQTRAAKPGPPPTGRSSSLASFGLPGGSAIPRPRAGTRLW
jgi:hypothetical protein